MIAITSEMLRDFQLCRYLYSKKHIDMVTQKEFLPERDRLVNEMDDALLRTIKFFYFETMGNGVPQLKALLNKWERLWLKSTTYEDVVNSDDHPNKNRNSYNTDAHIILNGFYQRNSRNPGEVLIIDESYEVPLTRQTKATGSMDLVLRRNNQVIMKHFGTRTQAQFAKGTENGWKIVLDAMAYRHKSERFEDVIEIEYLKNNKVISQVVNDIDINQTKKLADEIADCKTYYPSTGNYWCNHCEFSVECWKWQ